MSAQPIQATGRGKRFTTCPACTAVIAPIPTLATQADCPHCFATFAVTEAPARKSHKPTQLKASPWT